MTENEISKLVVDAAYKLHARLGPGLLETVYEVILAHELRKAGLEVARQVPVPIAWEGVRFDEGFRADLIVNDRVILELKSVDTMHPVHSKQLLTYLRVTELRLGLLINFGERLIKNGIKRVVNGLPDDPAP
ncbi:MAG: GxxExxY protein [Roseimicrobium sp.]